jgi:hypothetical protein
VSLLHATCLNQDRYPQLNMTADRIILEDTCTTHQKIHLSTYAIVILMFTISLLIRSLNYKGYLIVIVLTFIFLAITSFAFSKKGFIKSDKLLFKGYFFKEYLLFKKKINLEDRPVVSILKHKRSQKFAFFSAAKPDLGIIFNAFSIHALNERHIKRDPLMYFNEEKNAEKALSFLTTDFDLRHELFSPNFR